MMTKNTIAKNNFAQLAAENGYTSHYSGKTKTMFIKKLNHLKGVFKPNDNFRKENESKCGFKIKESK